MKRKFLQGYVENRTKEAALAAMLLALFFVARTFKIPVSGVFFISFSAATVFTAASVLSWPYTLVFSLATLYQSSNVLGVIPYFFASQVVFFLSKIVGKRRASHTPVSGAVASLLSWTMVLHVMGIMDFRISIATWWGIPAVINTLATYFGGLLIWDSLRRFRIVE